MKSRAGLIGSAFFMAPHNNMGLKKLTGFPILWFLEIFSKK